MCRIYKYINVSSNTKRDSVFWAKKFSNTVTFANSNICKKKTSYGHNPFNESETYISGFYHFLRETRQFNLAIFCFLMSLL